MTITRRLGAAAIASLAAAVSLPAAVAAPDAAPHGAASCFYVSQISNLRADGQRTLYARVGGRGVYRFDLVRDCAGLPQDTVALEPTPSGSICGPIDVDLTVGDHGTSERCLVRDIVHLTAQEAAALPKGVQP